MTDESWSAWIERLRSLPGPMMWSCPMYSSRVRGLMRYARGWDLMSILLLSKSSAMTPPQISPRTFAAVLSMSGSGVVLIRISSVVYTLK